MFIAVIAIHKIWKILLLGLKNSKVSTYEQAEKGETYLYNSKNKSKQIVYMMYQFDILFFIKEEEGPLSRIEVNYEAGLDTSDPELRFLKSQVNFQIGLVGTTYGYFQH